MIFLTVGTQFPFDRLVRAVDEAVGENGLDEQIFAQVGASSYRPKNFETVPELEKSVFDKYFREAVGVISHAGMGCITIALEKRKPLLVMPRLKKYGEVVNDHQVVIAKKFEKLGHLLVAYSDEELLDKIKFLRGFVPQKREVHCEAVAARISDFLCRIDEKK
jgi:UDP-N-acetylglucosamine transferase subunit ALG13